MMLPRSCDWTQGNNFRPNWIWTVVYKFNRLNNWLVGHKGFFERHHILYAFYFHDWSGFGLRAHCERCASMHSLKGRTETSYWLFVPSLRHLELCLNALFKAMARSTLFISLIILFCKRLRFHNKHLFSKIPSFILGSYFTVRYNK